MPERALDPLGVVQWKRTPLPNLDILQEVCKVAPDAPSALALTATCTTLRNRNLIRHILYSQTISVKLDNTFFSFFRFVFKDKENRVAYLRSLELRGSDWPLVVELTRQSSGWHIGANRLLITLLINAIRLEHLDLGGPMMHMSTMRSATLRELPVTVVLSDDPCEIVQAIRSPLRSLKGLMLPIRQLPIEVDFDEDFELEPIYPGNLYPYLSTISHSLEELAIDALNTDIVLDNHCLQFPTVKSLLIAGLFGPPRLDVLMYTFPSLSDSLTVFSPFVAPKDVNPTGDWVQIITDNVAAQTQPGAWKQIHRVVGHALPLYLLGLRCRVPVVYIVVDNSLYHRNVNKRLAGALDMLRPVHLTFDCLEVESLYDADILPGMFSLGVGDTLTHVTLGIRFVECPKRPRNNPPRERRHPLWEVFVERLLAAISHLRRISHFHLHMYEISVSREDWYFIDPPVDALPSRLAAALPSLRYVLITRSGPASEDGQPCEHVYGWDVRLLTGPSSRRSSPREEAEPLDFDCGAEPSMFMLEKMYWHEAEAMRSREGLEVGWK